MLWRDGINPQGGRYDVLLKRGAFVDPERGNDDGSVRTVPFKIYHPAGIDLKEPVPVIFWSHGFGGNQDGAAFLSRYLAAHGYALVHTTHHGTDSSLWEGKSGHPWDILKQVKVSRATSINRFLDIGFVLDSLPGWLPEDLAMDFSALGMSGHSFGAMTAQVIAGQKFPDAEGDLASLHDPRFKAGILYSPVPISHLSDAPPSEIYGPIAIPLLHMTGTQDDSPIEGYDYAHRLLVHDASGHPEKHLFVLNDGDHMVYNGTRGKLAVNPKRELHEDFIKIAALAFWDAYLKDDAAAKKFLAEGGMNAYLAGEGTYKVTMP